MLRDDWDHIYCEDNPCDRCHEYHKENWDVIENYKHRIRCCVDEVEDALADGEMCRKHIEWLGKLTNGQWWCDGCGEADANYNGHPKPRRKN